MEYKIERKNLLTTEEERIQDVIERFKELDKKIQHFESFRGDDPYEERDRRDELRSLKNQKHGSIITLIQLGYEVIDPA